MSFIGRWEAEFTLPVGRQRLVVVVRVYCERPYFGKVPDYSLFAYHTATKSMTTHGIFNSFPMHCEHSAASKHMGTMQTLLWLVTVAPLPPSAVDAA